MKNNPNNFVSLCQHVNFSDCMLSCLCMFHLVLNFVHVAFPVQRLQREGGWVLVFVHRFFLATRPPTATLVERRLTFGFVIFFRCFSYSPESGRRDLPTFVTKSVRVLSRTFCGFQFGVAVTLYGQTVYLYLCIYVCILVSESAYRICLKVVSTFLLLSCVLVRFLPGK